LNFCNGGCIPGVNCATGFTHSVRVYVRTGNAWKRVLSRDVTEPIFVSADPRTDELRALVMSVHGGDTGCPIRDKNARTRGREKSATSSSGGTTSRRGSRTGRCEGIEMSKKTTAMAALFCAALAYAEICQAHPTDSYTLDRAYFATSTDWFLIDKYPTPKKVDPERSLIFRRLYFIYVDDQLRSGFANTVSFVCQKKGYLNHLLVHLPDDADIKTLRPRKQWLSRTELRVLADDFTIRFHAEYLNGDFFVDFTDETTEDLVKIMESKYLVIEFGPESERIALYAGDRGSDGRANFKGALREMVPMAMKPLNTKMRVVNMSEMFGLCRDYKARPVRR
jgi:hypothetical protein